MRRTPGYLKRFFVVMGFLITNVLRQPGHMRRTDGERTVTLLPVKQMQIRTLLFDPYRRLPFDVSYQVADFHLLSEATQEMNMIRHTSND